MSEVILETRGLTKSFGGLVAINSLDIICDLGEILGVIGPNGAGKTTLFNLISGVYPPTKGIILFKGLRIDGKKMFERGGVKISIDFRFQITSLKTPLLLRGVLSPAA